MQSREAVVGAAGELILSLANTVAKLLCLKVKVMICEHRATTRQKTNAGYVNGQRET